MTEREALEDAIDQFPFSAVQEHMAGVGWRWGTRLSFYPSTDQMRDVVRNLFSSVRSRHPSGSGQCSTGGFLVAVTPDSVTITFRGKGARGRAGPLWTVTSRQSRREGSEEKPK